MCYAAVQRALYIPKQKTQELPLNATRTGEWSKFIKCSNARKPATEFCRGALMTSNRFAGESPAKYLRSAIYYALGRCPSSSVIKARTNRLDRPCPSFQVLRLFTGHGTLTPVPFGFDSRRGLRGIVGFRGVGGWWRHWARWRHGRGGVIGC